MRQTMTAIDIGREAGYAVCRNFNFIEGIAHMDKPRPDEHRLYRIAERQAGYFTRAQALAAGYSDPLLAHHVRGGKFQRVRRGVYRWVAFPEMPHADLFIAWLSTGPQAVLSHESALALYGLSDLLPGEIHLTVPRTASRRRKGMRLHTARLRPDEVTMREGLPVTTLPRTLADLIRSGVSEEWIRQAVQQALAGGLVQAEDLLADAQRRGGKVAKVISEALMVQEGA